MVQAFLSVLRRPRVIVSEIALLGFMAVLGTFFPQLGSASAVDIAAFHDQGWFLLALINLFALDHIFQSIGFALATVAASASLLVAVTDQFHRLRLAWSKPLTEADFSKATFRAEFDRPARTRPPGADSRMVHVKTEGKLGWVGSLVFHVGLLLVVLAGVGRALFGSQAVVDLMEGETLPPTAEAWSAQWPGVWANPFRLQSSITLTQVTVTNYSSGALRDLRVWLAINAGGRVRSAGVAINQDLHTPGGRLYLGSDFGLAPLIEWRRAGHSPVREAPLLAGEKPFVYEGTSTPAAGLRAYLRVRLPRTGERPDRLEVRVMKGPALLFVGTVRVGSLVAVVDGMELRLQSIPFWVRLHASRDPALWLIYLGFIFVISGATILFAVIKIDLCVAVSSVGGIDRVFVALKAQRLGPLFEARFRRWVREQGGPL